MVMVISKCFKNNNKCYHAIVINDKLEIKRGDEIYKMIEKEHIDPKVYTHFFLRNDPGYLKQHEKRLRFYNELQGTKLKEDECIKSVTTEFKIRRE